MYPGIKGCSISVYSHCSTQATICCWNVCTFKAWFWKVWTLRHDSDLCTFTFCFEMWKLLCNAQKNVRADRVCFSNAYRFRLCSATIVWDEIKEGLFSTKRYSKFFPFFLLRLWYNLIVKLAWHRGFLWIKQAIWVRWCAIVMETINFYVLYHAWTPLFYYIEFLTWWRFLRLCSSPFFFWYPKRVGYFQHFAAFFQHTASGYTAEKIRNINVSLSNLYKIHISY